MSAVRLSDLSPVARARLQASDQLPARPKTKAKLPSGFYEDALATRVRMLSLPTPEREFRFHPRREWRFDLAWPDRMLACEIEGGVWSNGAHTRGKHFTEDCEKYAEALIAGWRVLRVTTAMVDDDRAVFYLERLLR